MIKKLVNFLLLALPLLLNACSKGGGREVSQFEIVGIRDVILDSSISHVLPITIMQTSGAPEPVEIEVYNLPQGITAGISPAKAIPDFSSILNFSQGGPPGIYNVKVTATSQHCYREYGLRLIAPGNDFTINGTRDISLNNANYADTISVTVAHVAGVSERVELYVRDLPTGAYADIQKSFVKPDFTSRIIFRRPTPLVRAGTYPIRIGGRNSSYSREYGVNLTMP